MIEHKAWENTRIVKMPIEDWENVPIAEQNMISQQIISSQDPREAPVNQRIYRYFVDRAILGKV